MKHSKDSKAKRGVYVILGDGDGGEDLELQREFKGHERVNIKPTFAGSSRDNGSQREL